MEFHFELVIALGVMGPEGRVGILILRLVYSTLSVALWVPLLA